MLRILNKKIVLYVVVWILVELLFFVGEIRFSPIFALWDSLMLVSGMIIVFYLNVYWHRKYSSTGNRYRIWTVVLILIISSIDIVIELLAETRYEFGVSHADQDWYTLFSVPLFIMYNSCAFFASELLLLQKEFSNQRLRISLLKEEYATLQLKLLRSQINPHFLFNSLNSIYSLSYLNDSRTSEKIMQLSEILRYVLYDCDSQTVLLKKEIRYLKNYIYLNQLRGNVEQNVELSIEGKAERKQIAPLILIPFVENAFKHSHIAREKDATISIGLYINNSELQFNLKNSIPANIRKNITFSSHGLGLENVKRRLNLQYPNRHTLNIHSGKTSYSVDLTMKF